MFDLAEIAMILFVVSLAIVCVVMVVAGNIPPDLPPCGC